jgi:hypothetical protein
MPRVLDAGAQSQYLLRAETPLAWARWITSGGKTGKHGPATALQHGNRQMSLHVLKQQTEKWQASMLKLQWWAVMPVLFAVPP